MFLWLWKEGGRSLRSLRAKIIENDISTVEEMLLKTLHSHHLITEFGTKTLNDCTMEIIERINGVLPNRGGVVLLIGENTKLWIRFSWTIDNQLFRTSRQQIDCCLGDRLPGSPRHCSP